MVEKIKRLLMIVVAGAMSLAFAVTVADFARAEEGESFRFDVADFGTLETNSAYSSADVPMVDFGLAQEVGRSYSSSLNFANTGEEAVQLRFEVKQEEGKQSWLALVGGRADYFVAAGETAQVALRMNIPEGAEKGKTQYAELTMMAQNESGEAKTQKIMTKITVVDEEMRYASEVKNSVKHFSLAQETTAKLEINNTGDVGFLTEVQVEYSPWSDTNNWTQSGEALKVEVRPGASQNFETILKTGAWGVFKVATSYVYLNEEGESVTVRDLRYVLCCPPWLLGLLAAVLLLVAGVLAMLWVKKYRRVDGR